MKKSDSTPMPDAADDRAASARLAELQATIDERDETIRLLNEALSRALHELELDQAA